MTSSTESPHPGQGSKVVDYVLSRLGLLFFSRFMDHAINGG
jgi:hypothetical protein